MHEAGRELIMDGYTEVRSYVNLTPAFARLKEKWGVECYLGGGPRNLVATDVWYTIQDGDLPGYGVYVFARTQQELDALDCPGWDEVKEHEAYKPPTGGSSGQPPMRATIPAEKLNASQYNPSLAKDATMRDYFAARAPDMPDWFEDERLPRPQQPKEPASIAQLKNEIIKLGGREGINLPLEKRADHRAHISGIDEQIEREESFHRQQMQVFRLAEHIWAVEQNARWTFFWADKMLAARDA